MVRRARRELTDRTVQTASTAPTERLVNRDRLDPRAFPAKTALMVSTERTGRPDLPAPRVKMALMGQASPRWKVSLGYRAGKKRHKKAS